MSQKHVRIRHKCSIDVLHSINGNLTSDQRTRVYNSPFKVLLDIPDMYISASLLNTLLKNWDGNRVGFKLRGTFVHFSPHDVAMILGLRVCGTHIDVFRDHGWSKVLTLLTDSRNMETKLDRADLCSLITKCRDADDEFLRLYISVAFVYFLFPLAGKGIHGHFFQLLDDLGETCRGYAWGMAVYDFLIQGIKNAVKSKISKTKHSEITIQGCVPLLQVWAFEHTISFDGPSEPLWPRIRKWNMSGYITKKRVKNICQRLPYCDEVIQLLEPTSEELIEESVRDSYAVVDRGNCAGVDCDGSWKKKYEDKCVEYASLKEHYDEMCISYKNLQQAYNDLHAHNHTHHQNESDIGSTPLYASANVFSISPPPSSELNAKANMGDDSHVIPRVETHCAFDGKDADGPLIVEGLHNIDSNLEQGTEPHSCSNIAQRVKKGERQKKPGKQLTTPYMTSKRKKSK